LVVEHWDVRAQLVEYKREWIVQNGKLAAKTSDASRSVRTTQVISTREAMPLTERSTILAFKAGRAFRRGGTNIVEPSADKGAIVIERGEDELLHFMWKNRGTEDTEEVRLSPPRRNASS
jgi:hypothetical protein